MRANSKRSRAEKSRFLELGPNRLRFVLPISSHATILLGIFNIMPFFSLMQACRKRGGWGLQPPNNLLTFADFVSEKGCKSQGYKIEDSNLYIFEEATRIYKKCNIF